MGDPLLPTSVRTERDEAEAPSGAYRPLPAVPTDAPTPLPSDEEPNTTGTFFLMIIFLMLIGGFWAIIYLTLLHR
jgi:hypothetical protein